MSHTSPALLNYRNARENGVLWLQSESQRRKTNANLIKSRAIDPNAPFLFHGTACKGLRWYPEMQHTLVFQDPVSPCDLIGGFRINPGFLYELNNICTAFRILLLDLLYAHENNVFIHSVSTLPLCV